MSFGVGVGDIIAVSELASKIRKRFVDSPHEYRAISDEVKILSNVLRDLEDAFPERDFTAKQQAHLHDIISGCRTVLNELERLIDKYCILDVSTSTFRQKAKRQWKKSTWDSGEVDNLRSRITSNVGLLNVFNGSLIVERVTRLNKTQDDQERQTTIDWLSPTDFSSQQSDIISRRQEGTGKYFLDSEEFKNWLDKKGEVLFCPGIPGAGKTIITATVIELLRTKFQANDVGIAFIYCNYKSKQEHIFKGFILCLLKQLIQDRPILPLEIKSLYQRYLDTRTHPSIDEVINVLRTFLAIYSRAFIVVDALDECSKSDREQLLETLFEFQSQMQINIFATSRPLPDVMKRFGANIQLEIRANDEDVQMYLENHILKLPSFVSRNSDLQKEIITQIINAVDGMFLLAQLHLESLRFKTTVKTIKMALKSLPKGTEALETIYKETFERIETQPKEHQDLAKNVLSWITYAKRPLTFSELQYALAVEIGESEIDEENLPDVEDIISVCTGLLTIDQGSSVIRLIHYTTQEYLEQIRLTWIPNAQAYIATICMTYISFETFAFSFHRDDEFLICNNIFLDYTAQYWGFHAREALNETVKLLIMSFLDTELKARCLCHILLYQNYFPVEYLDAMYLYGRMGPAFAEYLVIYFGLEELLPILFKKDHSLYLDDTRGAMLSWAAAMGNETALKLLIAQYEAKADSEDESGRTPLAYAAENGHEAVVNYLVERADVEADLQDDFGRTPLSYAALKGYVAIVEFLMNRVDVEADRKNDDGETPLFLAACKGQKAVVELLVKREDVDANSENKKGQTPLYIAAVMGHQEVVDLLMKQKNVVADERNLVWSCQSREELRVNYEIAEIKRDLGFLGTHLRRTIALDESYE